MGVEATLPLDCGSVSDEAQPDDGLLDGVELADSLVWDAHKMLRAPIVCAAVLVRERRDLEQAFHQEASYLFHEEDQPGSDPTRLGEVLDRRVLVAFFGKQQKCGIDQLMSPPFLRLLPRFQGAH